MNKIFSLHHCVLLVTLFISTLCFAQKTLWVGESFTCDASSATMGSITDVSWSASGGYISLSGSGFYRNVTATQYWSGTATVRCTWKYTLYYGGTQYTGSKTWNFTCQENPVNISPTSMTMYVGETRYVTFGHTYTNSYSSYAQPYLSCSSSCISVSSDGTVKALSPGTAYINVYSKLADAGIPRYCLVTVKEVYPSSISLPGSLTLTAGQTKTITPTVLPSGASYTLTWTSNNEDVATVSSSGVVLGKKHGTAKITAKIDGYNLSDYCNVTVEKSTLTLKANPTSGLIEQGTKVILTAGDNDAEIFYTLDGKTPNRNSLKYNGSILINSNLTLKAIAYHDDYKPSDVLTETYKVTDLKIIKSSPENDATNMGRKTVPYVTYNTEINKGEYFSNIKLTHSVSGKVSGDIFISGKSLYFVPSTELDAGNYALEIPENSLTDNSSVPNGSKVIKFSVISSPIDKIKKIEGSRILNNDGTLYVWGTFEPNTDLLLTSLKYNYPDPSIEECLTPFVLYEDVNDIYERGGNYYVLKNDGTLIGWGGNYNFNSSGSTLSASCKILGDGTKISRSTPVTILSDVKKLCGGSWHQGVIKNDNSLWMWGRNACGQIGNGKYADEGQLSPVKVLDNVKDASFGTRHSVALKNDGSVWVWGSKTYIGTSSSQSTPIKKMTDVKAISSKGTDHVLVLKNDGTAWAFGENSYGQIGDGSTTNRTSPVKVLSDVIFIEASEWQNIAIKEDGSLWRWGFWCNGFGGSVSEKYWLTPRKILSDVVEAHANSYICFALKKDGTLWAMGENYRGQLGDGTETNRTEMVHIMNDVVKFWTSTSRTYALKKDGSLWGWGRAQVGDGTTASRRSPIKIWDGQPPVKLSDVELLINENKNAELSVGEQIVCISALTPVNGEYNSMTWSVEDENVASITQRGVLTAKGVGKTKVTLEVSTETDKFVRTKEIEVVPPPSYSYYAIDGTESISTDKEEWATIQGRQPNAIAIADEELRTWANSQTNVLMEKIDGLTKPYTCSNFVLTDLSQGYSSSASEAAKTGFFTPVTFKVTKGNYKRQAYAGYNTLCLPFSFKASELSSSAKVFTFDSYDEDKTKVIFKAVSGTIEAGTPCIVKEKSNVVWTVNLAGKTVVANQLSEETYMRGTYVTTDSYQGKGYAPRSSDNKFAPLTQYLHPFRACLLLDELDNADARGSINAVFMDEDGATVIDEISAMNSAADAPKAIYTLSGQRVNEVKQSGLYIVNGEKQYIEVK